MKRLAKSKGVMMEEPEYFGPRCFSDEIIRLFPELAAELRPEAELIEVQVGLLASAARAAIERKDIAFLRRVFTFLENVLSRPRIVPAIESALASSFLLPTDFDASPIGKQVWESLPARVRRALEKAV